MTCHGTLVLSRFLTWHSKVRCNCSGKLRERFRNISKHRYIHFLHINFHLHTFFFFFFLSLSCSRFCFSTTASEFYRLTSHACLSHSHIPHTIFSTFQHYSSITLQLKAHTWWLPKAILLSKPKHCNFTEMPWIQAKHFSNKQNHFNLFLVKL